MWSGEACQPEAAVRWLQKEDDDRRGEGGNANSCSSCIMLAVVRALLIQVNPAGTSTYGRRAQLSGYAIIPYSLQIKG